MSNKFISSPAVDVSKEREWSSQLGMLDWDTTSIVFTKRSLIEFLRYTGTTVDTNFANVQKLPRYAKFGKISVSDEPEPEAPPKVVASPSQKEQAPQRRHTELFSVQDEGALASAPPPPEESFVTVPPTTSPRVEMSEEESGIDFRSEHKPSRRVREQPGGASSVGSIFGSTEVEEFKPTRKVTQRPGGHDSISNFF
ncbi:hypothetical protein BDV98DRAFT_556823 [Pterulicium gracile]|uniref:Uncharacterized protein n=1 Tax=Pterulicium gracile TaxID=1884261 RepID=A0A5C3QY79_9AGAR|nr:hypothetical protein BDV98DRAFT_556823 [Pterula gracilis]